MRASRTPAPASHARDVAALLRDQGPFLTVYLTAEAAVENAAQLAEQHWKPHRARLVDEGVPEQLLHEVDGLVGPAHLQGRCLAVIGTAAGVVLAEHHHEPPVTDLVRWGPLPALAPLLEWRQRRLPHLVVLVDRVGADVLVIDGSGPDRAEEARGDDEPVHRSGAGGWSQRRYEQRTERTWEENAASSADLVNRLAEEIGARVVVVAGDVRAVALLRDRLARQVDDMVRHVDGGRAPDGSADDIAAAASTWVASAVAEETARVLAEYHQSIGRGELAVAGADAVTDALCEARVETLLVPGDAPERPLAWFGPDPVPLARSAEALADLGIDPVREGPLLDVLTRGALGTDAGVRIVPGAAIAPHQAGALLRW